MENRVESDEEEDKILALYHEILKQWNKRNAVCMANLFEDNGDLIGFDGSQFNSKEEIEKHLSYIFANHSTPKYVGKIRSIRFLNQKVGVLIGVGGLVEPDTHDIRQELNAIQTLVASKQGKGEWKIAIYQNTPAAFHGRPELGERLTEELRQVLYQHGPAS
jgi:uncharacterized protein (TIGR02246 family)